MENTTILSKIRFLPPELKEEVNDFIDFLLARQKKGKKKKQPKFGAANGKIITSPDFDDPLEDFKEYM